MKEVTVKVMMPEGKLCTEGRGMARPYCVFRRWGFHCAYLKAEINRNRKLPDCPAKDD
ncbi:MAG: hypothetical protein WC683_20070 [bacterium]